MLTLPSSSTLALTQFSELVLGSICVGMCFIPCRVLVLYRVGTVSGSLSCWVFFFFVVLDLGFISRLAWTVILLFMFSIPHSWNDSHVPPHPTFIG
jgi:hypothetical protein